MRTNSHAWYCEPGQKPMVWEVMGPSGETTVIVLLNDLVVKLPSKYLCLCTCIFFLLPTSVREASLFSRQWVIRRFKIGEKLRISDSECSGLDGPSVLTSTLQGSGNIKMSG